MEKHIRILLVDDYKLVRTTLARCLNDAGYIVIEAGDGIEALNQLQACVPDAIVCDVSMPRMDGFQLRTRLQSDEHYQSIPFLFLTAHDSEEEMLRGLDLEPDDYLSKNVSHTMLVKKIETVIKRHRTERKAATADLAKASIEAGVQLLPEHPPLFPGFSLLHLHVPYQEIPGGDFFDYIRISDDTLIVVLGDVMGKKWSAWMFAHAYMGYVRSSIRALASSEEKIMTPASILQRLNTELCSDETTAEVLCTLSVVRLCSSSSDVLYANAAHVPALLLRYAMNQIETIDQGGEPLGFSMETEYTDRTIAMEEKDILLLTTDGITDACNIDGEAFGEDSLRLALQARPPWEIFLKSLYRSALQWSNSGSLDDDATLLGIQKRNA